MTAMRMVLGVFCGILIFGIGVFCLFTITNHLGIPGRQVHAAYYAVVGVSYFTIGLWLCLWTLAKPPVIKVQAPPKKKKKRRYLTPIMVADRGCTAIQDLNRSPRRYRRAATGTNGGN